MAKQFVDLVAITLLGATSFVDVAGVPKDATVNYIYTETTPTTPQETTADLMTVNLYYIADRNDAGIYTGGEWEYMAIASVVSDVSEIEGGGIGDCYAVIKETAITDLTGTIWNVPNGWSAISGYGKFSLEGSAIFWNDGAYSIWCDTLCIGYQTSTTTKDNAIFVIAPTTGKLFENIPFTIRIAEGGTDATNPDLISWLETNAELVSEETESVIGTWVFNETPSHANEVIDVIVDGYFYVQRDYDSKYLKQYPLGRIIIQSTSNNSTFPIVMYDYPTLGNSQDSYRTEYNKQSGVWVSFAIVDGSGHGYIPTQSSDMELIRTIIINSDVTNTAFITWLKANATKVEETPEQPETPTKKFTRLYIGETVYSSKGKRFRKLQDTEYVEPSEPEETESIIGTWVFEDILDFSVYDEDPIFNTSATVAIDFTSNGENYNELGIYEFTASGWSISYQGDVNAYSVYSENKSPHWNWQSVDTKYHIIEITGGADIENETFITWLKANATKVGDSIVGTWVFNDTINNNLIGDERYEFDFTSSGGTFTYFRIYDESVNGWIGYGGTYDNSFGEHMAYTYDEYGWGRTDSNFQTIKILTEPTNETFINWLKANATKL